MFVLASASPRRKELLRKIIPDFDIDYLTIDETAFDSEKIAYYKGEPVARRRVNDIVISGDTQVILNDEIFGKPKNELDAFRMLKTLSDQTHQVITYYAIFALSRNIVYQNKCVSTVTFNKLSDELINDYVKSGSPLDKAGAYGIQDSDEYHFIKKYTGSLDNIIGLPVLEIKNDLIRLGLLSD